MCLAADFLDTARTRGICGDETEDLVEDYNLSSLWELPAVDKKEVTTIKANSELTVFWDLHYAHNGGWAIDIFESLEDDKPLISWENLGCSADATN